MAQIRYSLQVQGSNGSNGHRRQTLPAWMRRYLFPTDGPDSGKALVLERWQTLFLTAVEEEGKPIVSLRAASQVGKTLLALGVGLRAAVDGRGVLLATSTETGARDLSRRVEGAIERSPFLASQFPSARSGPGARASWRDRRLDGGGWLGLAAAGSASQLASRTAAVAIADEVSRWPRSVRSGEGHPLVLLRARLSDWGDEGRLLAISSPVLEADAIGLLFRDGDRRRCEYRCPDCGNNTPFTWSLVTGRERDEVPEVTCLSCGVPHGEDARRKMLRSCEWVAQRPNPTDEDSISFTLSRLDSARASLAQVVREWRRSRLAVERGDPSALRAFRNLVLGEPGTSGTADIDKLFELREDTFQLDQLEQVTCGVDVQSDRLVYVVLGFNPGNVDCLGARLRCSFELGDPREDARCGTTLAAKLARPFGGLPPFQSSRSMLAISRAPCKRNVRSADGGFRPLDERELGKPIAKSSWSLWDMRRSVKTTALHGGPVASRLEMSTYRGPSNADRDFGDCARANVLVAEGGALRWRPVDGLRANHLWDAAINCVPCTADTSGRCQRTGDRSGSRRSRRSGPGVRPPSSITRPGLESICGAPLVFRGSGAQEARSRPRWIRVSKCSIRGLSRISNQGSTRSTQEGLKA